MTEQGPLDWSQEEPVRAHYDSLDKWPVRLRQVFYKIVGLYSTGDSDLTDSDMQYLSEHLTGNLTIVTRNIRYDEILIRVMSQYPFYTDNSMFFISMNRHLQNIHESVTTAMEKNQYHAVYTLMRVWVESVATLYYVWKTPGAVGNLRKNDILLDAKGKKVNVIEFAEEGTPDIGSVYYSYSSFVHFDYRTVLSHWVAGKEDFTIRFNLRPEWKEVDKQRCLQHREELYEAGCVLLSNFARKYLPNDTSHKYADFTHPDYEQVYDLKYRELLIKWAEEGIEGMEAPSNAPG